MARRPSNISSMTKSDTSSKFARRTTRASLGISRHDKKDSSDVTALLDIVSLTDRSDAISGRKRKMENTYKMDPDKVFRACEVEKIAEKELSEQLKDVEYSPNDCRDLSQTLAKSIMEKVKSLGLKRYKIVTNVSLGSLKEKPGMQFGSRCLWNKNTDNFVSVKFSNSSIFAVAMVYGLYFD